MNYFSPNRCTTHNPSVGSGTEFSLQMFGGIFTRGRGLPGRPSGGRLGGGARRAHPAPPPAGLGSNDPVGLGRELKGGRKGGSPSLPHWLPPSPAPSSPMVPAAGALLWALLLSLGPRAAGAEGLTSTAMPRDSFRFGGPVTRSYRTTARTTPGVVSPRMRVTMEDEDDVVAAADRLAGPAAAELLASTVATGSRARLSQEEDGSLEEGVVIYARKNDTESETDGTTRFTSGRPSPDLTANDQDSDIKMSSSLPPSTWKANVDSQPSESTTNLWSSAESTLNRWPPPSPTAMPAPEDLRLVLLPWGPWHCHCKSGTMSRTRAGRLHGLSGRLRVGALSQLRTEHRPCTYHLCPCSREREECPLDAGLCANTSCTTQATTRAAATRATTTTTTPLPPLTSRLRPAPFIPSPVPSPHPAYAFWKRVRIGLEDIWNNLSTMFTEMEPVSV